LDGPRIDSSDQILHVRESLLEEKACGVSTSHPMVAVGDDFGILVQFGKGIGKGAERNENGVV
jgi:hypothetical protein